MEENQSLRATSEQVAAQVMEGEAVLINLSNGLYYRIAGIGGWVWTLMAQGLTLQQMAERVAAHYGLTADDVRADLSRLAEALVTENLVTVQSTNGAADETAADTTDAPDAYTPPALEKFSDMEEMFALDPPLPGLANPPPHSDA